MEQRITSKNKRIIEFYNLIQNDEFREMMLNNKKLFEEEGWSCKELSSNKARVFINDYLQQFGFEISKDCYSHQNLGNNRLYDVIDHDVLDDVETRIGSIAINHYLYSLMIYIQDFDEQRLGDEWFELNAHGITVNKNKNWISWEKYVEDNHLKWNLKDMDKEPEIREIIHRCIETDKLQVINGHIMIIRETTDGGMAWCPATYEEIIEDLKNEEQFESLKAGLQDSDFFEEDQGWSIE